MNSPIPTKLGSTTTVLTARIRVSLGQRKLGPRVVRQAYGCRRLSESEARSRLAMGDDEGGPAQGAGRTLRVPVELGWVWVKIRPGIGPQVLVYALIYQGKPF